MPYEQIDFVIKRRLTNRDGGEVLSYVTNHRETEALLRRKPEAFLEKLSNEIIKKTIFTLVRSKTKTAKYLDRALLINEILGATGDAKTSLNQAFRSVPTEAGIRITDVPAHAILHLDESWGPIAYDIALALRDKVANSIWLFMLRIAATW